MSAESIPAFEPDDGFRILTEQEVQDLIFLHEGDPNNDGLFIHLNSLDAGLPDQLLLPPKPHLAARNALPTRTDNLELYANCMKKLLAARNAERPKSFRDFMPQPIKQSIVIEGKVAGRIEEISDIPGYQNIRIAMVDVGEKDDVGNAKLRQVVWGGADKLYLTDEDVLSVGDYVVVALPLKSKLLRPDGKVEKLRRRKYGKGSIVSDGMICSDIEACVAPVYGKEDQVIVIDLPDIEPGMPLDNAPFIVNILDLLKPKPLRIRSGQKW